jgi:hypothetical protein
VPAGVLEGRDGYVLGAEQQVADLLARDPAAHAALDKRLPAEGLFGLFRKQPGHETRYRFGREPGGGPAPSWGWNDLD